MFGTEDLEIMIAEREGREPNIKIPSTNQLTVEFVEKLMMDIIFRNPPERKTVMRTQNPEIFYKVFEECWKEKSIDKTINQ